MRGGKNKNKKIYTYNSVQLSVKEGVKQPQYQAGNNLFYTS